MTTGPRPLIEYQVENQGRLVSYSQPAPGIDPATFLHYAQGRPRFYWQDGRTGVTFAGMGIAADLMAWGETRIQGIERQARELFAHAVTFHSDEPLAAPRLFGGFAFREDFVPDLAWVGFNPAHFILPHYQLVQHDEACWLTINALLAPEENPEANEPQLREALQQCYHTLLDFHQHQSRSAQGPRPAIAAHVATVTYPMPYPTWAAMIGQAQAAFQRGTLQKVVLARVCEVQLPDLVDLEGALAYLQRRYAECYTFLFEPQPHHAFFGATPELLIATHGRHFTTMGLAGSIQRGATPAEDERLGQALLASSKDRHEHALVVAAVRQRLEPLVDELMIPDRPMLYQLSNIQHLYTPIQGTLGQEAGVLSLVEILHPTPALGGSPREGALAFISAAETVPRGWYAAPVGWIDHNLDGTFGVAIRSAVAQRQRAWLYAGAGIVAESEPQKEWEETGWKFRPIQEALGII
ncbi:MAG: isochorismate synthase [Caldilineaceae bacterium]|nr:isochorismate synthase [Caldilineaceae bacterium]